jgi:hypothetical protein
MKKNHGVILVLAYARPDLLNELFESIYKLTDVEEVSIVVVRQIGIDSVDKTLKKWRGLIEVLVETDGSAGTAAENISRNRLAGYAVSFDSLGADWVLAVEDDVLLASDTVLFTKCMFEKYVSHRNFRAINLGSRLSKSEIGHSTYCLTRFGVIGQASVLPRATWQKMRRLGIIEFARSGHWDSAMEAFVKTGFCVAPNNSRYIDRGWVDATHMSSNPEEDYYKDISASFNQLNQSSDNHFKRMDLGYWWRADLKKYRNWKNLFYWIAFASRSPIVIRTYRKLRTFFLRLRWR